MKDKFSTKEYFEKLDKYWRAANYLSAAQLYLLNNPLMRDHELCMDDIKKNWLGTGEQFLDKTLFMPTATA